MCICINVYMHLSANNLCMVPAHIHIYGYCLLDAYIHFTSNFFGTANLQHISEDVQSHHVNHLVLLAHCNTPCSDRSLLDSELLPDYWLQSKVITK